MTRIAIALLTALMSLSGGCVIAVVDRSTEGSSRTLQSEYHQALDLKSGGAISLDNTDGDIEISGWTEERVDITAYGRRYLPPAEGIYFLGGHFSSADIRVQKRGDTVNIETEAEDHREGERIVHYIVKVPRSVRLERISTGRGDILISGVYGRAVVNGKEGQVAVENYSGSLDIRLATGNVEAELLDLRPEDSILITVERGDIVIHLETGIAACFSLEAPAGTISSELDLHQPLPAQKVSSTTGEGGAALELTALQGDIKIRKVEGST